MRDYAFGWNAQGLGHFFRKDYPQAGFCFTQARLFAHDLGVTDYNLGILYFQQGDFPRSETHYLRSIRSHLSQYRDRRTWPVISGELARVYNNLGTLKERQELYGEAAAFYEKSLEADPSFVSACYNMAVVHWKMQKWDEVVFYLEKTLRMDPSHKEARYYLDKLSKKRLP